MTVGCVVPNFAFTSTADAANAWSLAKFSGTIRYKDATANGNSQGSPNPPSPSKIIDSQSLAGGLFTAPTKQGNTYHCDSDITVTYQP